MEVSKDRYRASLVGALIGDCLGAPFECDFWNDDGISKDEIFQTLKFNKNDGEIDMSNKKEKHHHFTGMV